MPRLIAATINGITAINAAELLAAVEAEIEQLSRTVEGAIRDLNHLDETHEGKKLNFQEKQGREALLSNTQRHKDNLASKQKYLEQLRKEAA